MACDLTRLKLTGQHKHAILSHQCSKCNAKITPHCNFLRYHFQPFGLNLVLPSVVKPSGEIAERGKRHPT